MESINILRLKTGEDIICYMEHYGHDEVVVRDPMMVMVRMDYKSGKQTIGMDHWLPTALIRDNEAIIKMADVLTVLTPSTEFTEYFENAVSVIHRVRNSSDEETSSSDDVLTQDDMSLILESMDTTEAKVVH